MPASLSLHDAPQMSKVLRRALFKH